MSQDYDILKKSFEKLEDILKWLKFLGFEKIRVVFSENFTESYEYFLYDMSDGKNTSRDLVELLSISRETITSHWDEWTVLGIMEKIPVKGGGTRGKRIFSLTELGIDLPKK